MITSSYPATNSATTTGAHPGIDPERFSVPDAKAAFGAMRADAEGLRAQLVERSRHDGEALDAQYKRLFR